MSEHPHDILINKLEECLEDLQTLDDNYELDTDDYVNAYGAVDNAIDLVRAIEL